MKSKTLSTIRSVLEYMEPTLPRKAYLTPVKRQSYTDAVSRPLAQDQKMRYQGGKPDVVSTRSVLPKLQTNNQEE